MLLKYSQAQKRMKLAGSGKPQRATGMMKMTSTMMNVVPRMHRKVIKNVASKRLNSAHHRIPAASKRHELRPVTAVPIDPCDNSNDSGLGFDQHIDYPTQQQQSILRFADQNICWSEGLQNTKRQRVDIKLESDDANDNFSLPSNLPQGQEAPLALCLTSPSRTRLAPAATTRSASVSRPTPTSSFISVSRDGRIQLQIVRQPEQQHRARYQTEGSRGAVKDRSGSGFPVVKLVGYDKPTTIQVFIGSDQGRVVPHMFYQACRVSGKNSTPCIEKKIDGTVVIEIEASPERDMTVTCDCVGILKERNVDVEHRFPEESPGRSRKKSIRCRMVFRTTIVLRDGTMETLEITSQPIVCTQPPGIPEISKKSLSACPAIGGLELYILGKNFLKDTKVVFRKTDEDWDVIVQPDKEFLQQSHLICVIPPYKYVNIESPVIVQLLVTSSGKFSEPHDFTYVPSSGNYNLLQVPLPVAQQGPADSCDPSSTSNTSQSGNRHLQSVMWPNIPNNTPSRSSAGAAGEEMPPPLSHLPIAVRRSSIQMIIPEALPHEDMKQEATETPSSTPIPNSSSEVVADLATSKAPSQSALHQFVSETPNLPSLSVDNYLTGIEVSTNRIESSHVTPYSQEDVVNQCVMNNTVSHSSGSQLHSTPPRMNECSAVSDIVHSQIIREIPQQQTSSNQLHSSPMIGDNTSVSDLVQSQILSKISSQSSTSRLHSSPLLNNCNMSSPANQTRYGGNSLMSGVSAAIDSTVVPLTSTLLINSSGALSFTQPLDNNTNVSTSQSIGEMLSSSGPSSVLQQQSASSLLNDSQSLRLSELVSSSIIQQSNTEKLDVFVNSAADSHISPGQNTLSPPTPTSAEVRSILSHETSLINPLLPGVQNSCPNTTITSAPLCSLLTVPPITTLEQSSPTSVTQSLQPNTIASTNTISDLIVPQNISSKMLVDSVNMQSSLNGSPQFADQQNFPPSQEIQARLMSEIEKPKVKEEFMLMEMSSLQCNVPSNNSQPSGPSLTTAVTASAVFDTAQNGVKKTEEGIPLGTGIQEITQMSEHDLISYINPSCFDQVE